LSAQKKELSAQSLFCNNVTNPSPCDVVETIAREEEFSQSLSEALVILGRGSSARRLEKVGDGIRGSVGRGGEIRGRLAQLFNHFESTKAEAAITYDIDKKARIAEINKAKTQLLSSIMTLNSEKENLYRAERYTAGILIELAAAKEDKQNLQDNFITERKWGSDMTEYTIVSIEKRFEYLSAIYEKCVQLKCIACEDIKTGLRLRLGIHKKRGVIINIIESVRHKVEKPQCL